MYKIVFLSILVLSAQHMCAATKEEMGQELVNVVWELFTEESDNPSFKGETHRKKIVMKALELIDQGADVNVRNEQGRTPIFPVVAFACDPDPMYEKLLQALIKAGADQTVIDNEGLGVFGVSQGCAMRKLLKNGFQVSFEDLYSIITHQDHEMIEDEIIEAAIASSSASELNRHLPWGPTLLMGAAERNRFAVVKSLITHGVHANAINNQTGETALHEAFAHFAQNLSPDYLREKYQIIRLLVEKGNPINAADQDGRTPLILAVQRQEYDTDEHDRRLIDLALALGSDPLQKDNNGLSALEYASHMGLKHVLASLIAAVEKYQPEKLDAAKKLVPSDLPNEIGLGSTLKEYMYSTYDFAIKCGALFAVYTIVMDVRNWNKRKVRL